MTMDRNKARLIAAEIRAALAVIAEKHGLEAPQVDLRPARDGSFCRLMKLDMMEKSSFVSREVVPPVGASTAATITGAAPALARALQAIGVARLTNSKGDEILEYKPSRPKYPFTYRGCKGGLWRASAADIQKRFG